MNEINIKWTLFETICVRQFCSHDYHQQRSVTSTSIESIIDDANDKRDSRRQQQQQQQQQRFNSSRQQQYASQNPSSSNNNPKERSYTYGIID